MNDKEAATSQIAPTAVAAAGWHHYALYLKYSRHLCSSAAAAAATAASSTCQAHISSNRCSREPPAAAALLPLLLLLAVPWSQLHVQVLPVSSQPAAASGDLHCAFAHLRCALQAVNTTSTEFQLRCLPCVILLHTRVELLLSAKLRPRVCARIPSSEQLRRL